jgi:hypothetical protein
LVDLHAVAALGFCRTSARKERHREGSCKNAFHSAYSGFQFALQSLRDMDTIADHT